MLFGDPYKPECFQCGKVELAPKNIVKLVKGTTGTEASYSFVCPECQVKQSQEISVNVFKKLQNDQVCPVTNPEALIEKEVEEFSKQLESEDFAKQFKKLQKLEKGVKVQKKTRARKKEKSSEDVQLNADMRKVAKFVTVVAVVAIIIVRFVL